MPGLVDRSWSRTVPSLLSRCTRMRVRTIAEWDLRGLIKAYFGAVRGIERGNEKVSGMHYLINWLT